LNRFVLGWIALWKSWTEPEFASRVEGLLSQAPTGPDPVAIRLTGNVQGSPPFRGVLKHHGWRVEAVHLPALLGARDESSVLAPAEVEIT
jgi:hypothetical protein